MDDFAGFPDLEFPLDYEFESADAPGHGIAIGEIESFVPHRGVMRLIDRLVEVTRDGAVAEADIVWDGPFVRDGGVPSWFAIEYMAQTVAAWAGYRARSGGNASRIGLLLGSRRFEVRCTSFAVGTTVRVEVRNELSGANGLGLFDCHVLQGDTVLATARLSVFEPDDAHEVLERLAS